MAMSIDGTSRQFGYDPLDRLVSASGPFGQRAYDYDGVGNRTALTADGVTTSYGYEWQSNRLASEAGWSYQRDANGKPRAPGTPPECGPVRLRLSHASPLALINRPRLALTATLSDRVDRPSRRLTGKPMDLASRSGQAVSSLVYLADDRWNTPMPDTEARGAYSRPARSRLRTLVIATFGITGSATMLWIATNATNFSWIAWIAFAPWLASLRTSGARVAAISGLAMGMAYVVPGRWDAFVAAVGASGMQGTMRTVLTTALFATYAVPFCAFAVLDALQRRWRPPKAMWAPLFQAGALAFLVSLAWTPFGYTPAAIVVDQRALLQVAELGGEPLVLLLMFWTSATLAAVLTDSLPRPRLALLLPVAVALVLAGSYGSARLAAFARSEASGHGRVLRVLPVQLDLPMFAARTGMLRDRPGQALSAIELTRRGLEASPQCDLAMWPEVPLPFADADAVCAQGSAIATSLGVPLLMQCYQPELGQRRVTATLFDSGGSQALTHAKSRLVPLYEKPMWGASGDFVEGAEGTVFSTNWLQGLIPALCYEVHSRAHLRQALNRGGDVVLHMASFTPFARTPIDAWDQRMARVLAVEFRLPMVRAANRGAVGWIDATGRVRSQSAQLGRSAECVEVWIPSIGTTPAAWLGPMTAWLPALIAILVLLACQRQTAARAPCPVEHRPHGP